MAVVWHGFINIVLDVMHSQVFCNGHVVADVVYDIVPVVHAVVEYGAHNLVVRHLHIVECGIELLEHLLYGQCHISRTSGKIYVIIYIVLQMLPYGFVYLLILDINGISKDYLLNVPLGYIK